MKPVKQSWPRYCVRFVFGRPLDGYRKTDATFFRRGTRVLDPNARPPSRWSYMPEWKRAGIRLASSTIGIEHAVLAVMEPMALAVQDGTLATGGAAVGYLRLRNWWERRAIDRDVALPLWRAMGGMGFPIADPYWRDWIDIPLNYDTNEKAIVKLRLPDTWKGDDDSRKLLSGLVIRKIGGEWQAHWSDRGKPYVSFVHPPKPPSMVLFSDELEYVSTLPEGKLFLGRDNSNSPVLIDVNAETPHIAMSIGTGGGKSSTLCMLIVQLLRQGATIEGIDPKGPSFNQVRHLDGIRIHRSISDQWDAITLVAAEMERRYVILNENENATFPRLVLVIEEFNSFYLDVQDYWEEIKTKSDKGKPEAFRKLNKILNKGRQVNVNVFSVFQRMDAVVAGGGAARAQYGYKILGRFDPQTYKMLIGNGRGVSSKHRGRVLAYDGDETRQTQTAYSFNKSGKALQDGITEWVENGRESVICGNGIPSFSSAHSLTGLTGAADLGKQAVSLTALREYSDMPDTNETLATLRWARANDPEFPAKVEGQKGKGGADLYELDALVRWSRNRMATRSGAAN